MDQRELIQIIIDVKTQLGVLAHNDANMWKFIGSICGFVITVSGTVAATLNRKFKKTEEHIRKSAKTMFDHNAEEFERFTNRLELIDKTNVCYDMKIQELIRDREHLKELFDAEIDNIRRMCDERHKK
jgi:hypothetical protein